MVYELIESPCIFVFKRYKFGNKRQAGLCIDTATIQSES